MDNKNGKMNGHQTVPKRRYESRSQAGPPPKKARRTNNNNQFEKTYTSVPDTIPRPDTIPLLPPISEHYEKIVFTHPGSTNKGEAPQDLGNYDRLEFLGDAYLEVIATRLIYDNYPGVNAGGMAQLRESVVKNSTLSQYSIMYGFDEKLKVPDFGHDITKFWTKIYGDVFEAYAAAVVLSDPEHGLMRLERWLRALWAPVLTQVKATIPEMSVKSKEELSRKVMCPGVKLNYVEDRKPMMHVGRGKETFFIGVYFDGWGYKNQHLGSGEGASKVIAGAEAALNAMNNHPLIDELIAKKQTWLAERAAAAAADSVKKEDAPPEDSVEKEEET